jgi:hypothetical protein
MTDHDSAVKPGQALVTGATFAALLCLWACGTGQPDPTATPRGGPPADRQFGILRSIDYQHATLTFTPAEFFEGDRALAEARKDGLADLPNPFYIRPSAGGRHDLAPG